MKLVISFLLLLITGASAIAQDITGDWYGILKVQGSQLDIVFHISEIEDGYATTMDSPGQSAFGIPLDSTFFEKNVLEIKAPALGGLQYEGKLSDTGITGTFKQGGMQLPLDLSREKAESNSEEVNRPQEPKRPFPYVEEDVTFENRKDAVTLSGTLTLPKKEGIFPAVVLISGSGPQNRNEEILEHKPFLVFSDYLTRHGIAVLRYDDRGVGESTGKFAGATSYDFSNDARAAVDFLKNRSEINSEEIGILGHSEGGMIAPMLAAEDKDIAFLVLMAGTGMRADKVLLAQQELVFRASGESEDNIQMIKETNKGAFEILNSSSAENLEQDLRAYFQQRLDKNLFFGAPSGSEQEKFLNQQVKIFLDPWMHFFITYDPSQALEKVDVPVLAINGEKDLQVPPKENLAAIEKALRKGGNDEVTVKEYAGLNHLFQESATGAPSEYGEIEQTIAPEVLEDVTTWILKTTGKVE